VVVLKDKVIDLETVSGNLHQNSGEKLPKAMIIGGVA